MSNNVKNLKIIRDNFDIIKKGGKFSMSIYSIYSTYAHNFVLLFHDLNFPRLCEITSHMFVKIHYFGLFISINE